MSGIDDFPEDEKQWLMHVGYLATNWAGAETILDGMIRTLHSKYGGDQFQEKPPHSAFNRKQEYVRKVFAGHPDLKGFSLKAESVMDEASRLAQIRHWALHGSRSETNKTTAALVRFMKSKEAALERKEFTLEEVYFAALDAVVLSLSLIVLSQKAFGLVPDEKFDQFISELVRESGTVLPSDKPAG